MRLWNGGLMTSCEKFRATMKHCVLTVGFLLAIGVQPAVCRASDEPCKNIKLPPVVSMLLEKSFPQWRVEKLSDLDPSYQELWTKKYSEDCPGFVAGHLQKADSIAYAVLLVPADQTKKGYRLVVLSKVAKNGWRSIVLEKDDQYTPTSAVIRLAPPGDYEEADSNKKVHTRTDGIVSERIEAGALVYYWNGARFRNIATSV